MNLKQVRSSKLRIAGASVCLTNPSAPEFGDAGSADKYAVDVEELNEEDQQLKSELEMLVERITVSVFIVITPCVITNDRLLGVRHYPLQTSP
jgi:hypothetical protein